MAALFAAASARLDASLPPGIGLGAAIKNVESSVKKDAANIEHALYELVQKIEEAIVAVRKSACMTPDEGSKVGSKRVREGNDELLGGGAERGTLLCYLDAFPVNVPKGKFPMGFYREGFSLGETFIARQNIAFTVIAPDVNARGQASGRHFLYVSLGCAHKMGKQNVSVVQIPETSVEGLSVETTVAISDLPTGLGDLAQGVSVRSLGRAISSIGEAPLETPDHGLFISSAGNPAVQCYHKANEGFLYPLPLGWLFSGKPLIFIPRTSVLDVKIGGSALKTIEVKITYKDFAEKRSSVEYGMVSREELPFLNEYIARSLTVGERETAGRRGPGHADTTGEVKILPTQQTIIQADFQDDDADDDFSPSDSSDENFSESEDDD